MKKVYNIILSSLLLCGACVSCSDENVTEGEGKLKLSMYVNDDVKVISRSISTEEKESLENSCTLYVYNSKSLVRKYHGIDEIPSELWMVSGDYRAEAWAGDSTSASFTSKYYKGVKEFEITKGQTTEANIECKIANVVASVKFASSVDGVLKDYKFTISNGGGSLEFTKEKEGQKGYFMMADGEKDLTWTITGTMMDNSTYTQEGTIAGVKPTTEYAVTVNYNGGFDVNMGGSMFNIKVDETALDVHNEFQLTAAPKIIGSGFDITQPYYGEPSSMKKINVYVTSATALTKFNLSGLSKWGFSGSDELEYFSMAENAKTNLTAFGMAISYSYDEAKDESILKLSIAQELLNGLSLGSYPLTISATDKTGKVRSQVLDLQVSNDVVKTLEANVDLVYATKATISGSIAKEGATGLGFEYKKTTEEAWTTISDVKVEGNVFTATIKDLSPSTTYQYRAKCSNDGSGNAFTSTTTKTFTTETILQLQNADFEIWSKSSDNAYIPAADESSLFWDNGNHGSITLNINITTPDNTVKNSGQYSAKLQSAYPSVFGIGKFAAGNIFTGKYLDTDGTDGILGFGRAFASRPTSLSGYVKYSPGVIDKIGKNDNVSGAVSGTTMDKGIIYVALLDESTETYQSYVFPEIIKTKQSEQRLFDKNASNVIAYGELVMDKATVDDSGKQMTAFDIPLVYKSTKKPTAILVVCSSSFYGDYFTGSTSSVMWVDDFKLNY